MERAQYQMTILLLYYVHPFHIVTCALDYKWIGIMDIETLLFLIEDVVTGCKYIV